MRQRTAILVAIGLTAFVVIMVGGIAYAMVAQTGATKETASENVLPLTVGGNSGAVELTPTTASPVLVQPARAAQVALGVMPNNTLQKTPELVNFQGKMAYEVLLSGGIVYVDAFTAQVLSSSVTVTSNVINTPVPNTAPNNPAPNPQTQDPPAENQPAFFDDNSNDNGDDHNDNDNDDDDHGGNSGHGSGNSGHGSSNSGKGGGGDDDDDDD